MRIIPPSERGFGAPSSRRGSAYVLVLAISLLVLVIGAGAITAARVEARASADLGEIGAARSYALSGIELARVMISGDANWRTTRTNGAWAVDLAIGDGTVTVEGVNPNGVLNRSPLDPVVITATGVAGKSRHKVQVRLAPSTAALSCLDTAVCAGGAVNLNSSTVLGTNQLVAANGAVSALLATVNANVESALTVTGLTFNGSVKSLAGEREFPDSSVFTYYVGVGTPISVDALDSSGGSGKTMARLLLSPSNNPYGTANPNGIYVIDCRGEDVIIDGCRIVGTLVLLNAGSATTVKGSVNWAPAGPALPCLLVQGNLALGLSAAVLSEVPNPKVNFNAAGTPYPYPAGVTDSDRLDTYPSMIDGLVYVAGNVSTSGSSTVDTLVAGGNWTANGTITLNYDSAIYTNPPPGFGGSGMVPVPGSWKQITN